MRVRNVGAPEDRFIRYYAGGGNGEVFQSSRASSPRRLARARHPRPQPRRNGDALGRDEDCNYGGRKITESEKALLRAKKCIYAKTHYIN